MTIQKFNAPGGKIWLEIDHADAATPALVCSKVGHHASYSSTYDCAMGTGFIDDRYELTPADVAWLEKQADRVEEAYTVARKDAPEYQ